jgi:flavodoxin
MVYLIVGDNMKIGIIVYSQTGHTLSAAKRLYEELKGNYSVNIERIEATREKNNNFNFTFDKEPDISKYDTIIFCSYVEGFSLCPVMKKYLSKMNFMFGRYLLICL